MNSRPKKHLTGLLLTIAFLLVPLAALCAGAEGRAAAPAQGTTPSPTPALRASGRIAFTNLENFFDGKDIYTVNPDGTGRTRLIGLFGNQKDPAWSPDGKYIAYSSGQRGYGEIWRADADGSNQMSLSDGVAVGAVDDFPAWSPDGSKIVFVRNKQLWTVGRDGGTAVKLSTGSDEDEQPSWSPDGRKIVFVRNYSSAYAQVWVMNADGTGQVNLSNYEWGYNRFPAWSPDGSRIAFQRWNDIWLMDADGSNQTQITFAASGGYLKPSWSPDGTQIVVANDINFDGDIFVMNADGSDIRKIADGVHPTWQSLPPLTLRVADSPDPVESGGEITYTNTVRNNHSVTATGVTFVNVIPTGTTYLSATPSQGTCRRTVFDYPGEFECTLGDLAPGAEVTITFVVKVTAGEGGAIEDAATVTATYADLGQHTETAIIGTIVHRLEADMYTFMFAPETIEPGQRMSYQIYAPNHGPDATRDVRVTNTLPPGVTLKYFHSFTEGNCTTPEVGATGTITCTFDRVEAFRQVQLFVEVEVNAPAGTTLENTTTVSAALDTDASNNSVTKTTLVVAPPAPANDDFAAAQEINGATGSVAGSNEHATKQPGEPAHAGNPGGFSVWYRWQAPAAGRVEFTTDGSGLEDTLLGVYTGAGVDALTEVASNDDLGIYSYASRVRFEAVPGAVYYIAVDSSQEWGSQGALRLGWTQPVAAPTPTPTPPTTGLIAFSHFANDERNNDLYTMNADGTGQTNITSTPSDNEEEPRWSPDGRKLAFANYREEDGVSELTLMNGDGTGRKVLFAAPNPVFHLEWSPDGTRLVFNMIVDGSNFEIYVVNADGTGLSRLTDNDTDDLQPHWSPDGSKIVYLFQSADVFKHVCVMNADGGDRRQLVDTPEGEDYANQEYAKWVPGTSRISYINTWGVLHTINADGTDVRVVLGEPGEGIGEYAWSRDGSRITFGASGPDNRWRQYLANADGTGRVLLTEGQIWSSGPQFSPDGSMITFDTIGKGYQGIYAIWANGAAQLALTDGTSQSYSHDWRPVTPPGDTPTGANVAVAENGVAVTFSNVTTAGETTVAPIDPNSLQGIPGEYVIVAGTLAFEIKTTAVYSGPITIGFHVPGIDDPDTFSALRVLHGEPPPVANFVDRTVLAPDSPAPDFATRTVYARVTSLSPFVVARKSVSYGVRALYDETKAHKSGSTVPIKLQLTNAGGANLSSAGLVVKALGTTLVSTNAAGVLEDAGKANPDFDFRYDARVGGYVFNLKTTGYAAGTYVLNFRVAGDPTKHATQFRIAK
ncbi:MAG TPA: DPP IV N-terminal domain-containing protein [Pyrinomonadaceae bacterium]|nr:DPP IV N-terminal domain-containing protein [Pyrinomonadaceae bacterium]